MSRTYRVKIRLPRFIEAPTEKIHKPNETESAMQTIIDALSADYGEPKIRATKNGVTATYTGVSPGDDGVLKLVGKVIATNDLATIRATPYIPPMPRPSKRQIRLQAEARIEADLKKRKGKKYTPPIKTIGGL